MPDLRSRNTRRYARAGFSLLAAGAVLLNGVSLAQPKKPITLDAVYADPPIVSRGITGVAWRDGSHFTYLQPDGGASSALWQVDAATGKKVKLLDPLTIPADEGGAKAKDAKKDTKAGAPEAKPKALSFTGSLWNPAGTALLLNGEDDLWLYDVKAKTLRRLTKDADEEEYPTFSPDGRYLAYVKKNDLWTVDVATGKETRLTTASGPDVLNGKLGWVYEEELAHRRSGRAYEWAPDSSAIAFLNLDESKVPTFPLVDFTPVNGKLTLQRYPKAGDPAPEAYARIVDLAGNITNGLQPARGDYVFPEFSWTPDSKTVAVVLLDHHQHEAFVQLLPKSQADYKMGRPIAGIQDPVWVNSLEPPVFLKDGSAYLFLAESTGFLHLYKCAPEGRVIGPITSGQWMVDGEWELDEKNGWVYFVGTRKDPRERHIYRARLDGTGLTQLSTGGGVHSMKLAPGAAYYLDTFSDATTPPKTALYRADGRLIAMVDEPKDHLAEFARGAVELGEFTDSEGTHFYTRLVKPPDFDPKKRYPVVVYVYGGPHAQVVQDRWGRESLFEQALAQKGWLVFAMDGRGSWGRGHAFELPIYRNLGEVELKDQLDGLADLAKRPYVDGSRVAIWGWSYGGYMTLYAATHAGERFKCAIAGAPVTDWKLYDNIYTERYMGTPKENPDGYKAASVLEAASKLGTKVMLIHGTSDDNVHMQNTLLFIDALVKAKKDFVFVPLLGQKHGSRDKAIRYYYQRRMVEFLEKNL